MTCNNELDYKEFKEYLESLGQDKLFADRRMNYSCPIAQYFISKGHNNVNVGVYSYSIDGFYDDLPLWASEFVDRVDTEKGKIKPKTALKYLKEVEDYK